MAEIFSGRALEAANAVLAETLLARRDTAEVLAAGRIGQTETGAVQQESLAGRFDSFRGASEGAIQNLLSARDLLTTTADVFNEQSSIFDRLRTLVEEAADLETSTIDRGLLDGQFRQGLEEAENLVVVNDFDGRNLLGIPGTAGTPSPVPGISLEASVVNVQAGIDILPEDNLALIIPFGTLESLAPGLSTADLQTQASATAALTTLDTAIDSVIGNLSLVEGQSRRIDAAVGVNGAVAFNSSQAADSLLAQDQTLDILDFANQELTIQNGIEANTDLTRLVLEAVEEFSRLVNQVSSLRESLAESAPENQGVLTAPIGPRSTTARLTGEL